MVLRNSGRVGSRRFGERRKPVQRNAGSAFGVFKGFGKGALPSARDGVRHLRQMGFAISGRCLGRSARDVRRDLLQMGEGISGRCQDMAA